MQLQMEIHWSSISLLVVFLSLFPAPNAYSIPAPKEMPSYSLSSRHKEPKKYVTPAPGAYEAPDTNNYKSKNPAFSLSTRQERTSRFSSRKWQFQFKYLY